MIVSDHYLVFLRMLFGIFVTNQEQKGTENQNYIIIRYKIQLFFLLLIKQAPRYGLPVRSKTASVRLLIFMCEVACA